MVGYQGACPEAARPTKRVDPVTRLSSPRSTSLADRRADRRAVLTSFILKLYVTGATPRAETAIANLRRICERELGGQYQLEIIDVLEHPQLAEDDKVLATPTLIKQLPPPLRKVIGDLSDKEKVLLGLELKQQVNEVKEDLPE
jgi:circadian clock protein KaiB